LRLPKKFPELFRMDAKQIEQELRTLAKRLEVVANHVMSLTSNAVEFPASHMKTVEAGICLRCNLQIEEGDEEVRGNHFNCYKAITREIAKGAFSEADAIRAGKLLPAKKGGRKLSQESVSMIETIKEVADRHQETAKAAKKSKASKRPESR